MTFPRYPLTFRPSPIHPLDRLGAHLGGARIWAKREDCNSGLDYGGNKIRNLECLVPDVLAQGADTLVSPYVDLTLSGETLAHKREVDPLLTPDGLRARVPDYVGGADAADPYISPIFGDLRELPPLLIQVGSHEILLSDALRLAGRAAISDVPVTLDVTPGVPHVFQAYAGLLDEAGAALDRASDFMKAQLAHSPSTTKQLDPASQA
jgi:hypothetical protein